MILECLGYADLSLLSIYHKDPQIRNQAFETIFKKLEKFDHTKDKYLVDLVLNFGDEITCLKVIEILRNLGRYNILNAISNQDDRESIKLAASNSIEEATHKYCEGEKDPWHQIETRIRIASTESLPPLLRNTVWKEAIEICVAKGEYKELIKISKHEKASQEVKDKACEELSGAISRAVFSANADRSVSSQSKLTEIALYNDLNGELRHSATVVLVNSFEAEKKFHELVSFATDENVYEESKKTIQRAVDKLALEIIDESFAEWKRKKDAKKLFSIALPWRGEDREIFPSRPISDEEQFLNEKFDVFTNMLGKMCISLSVREHAAAKIIEIDMIAGYSAKLPNYTQSKDIPNNLRVYCGRKAIAEDSKNLDNPYKMCQTINYALSKDAPSLIVTESVAFLEQNREKIFGRLVRSFDDHNLIKIANDDSFSASIRMEARCKIEEVQLAKVESYKKIGRYEELIGYINKGQTETVRDTAKACVEETIENYLTKIPESKSEKVNYFGSMLLYFAANHEIAECYRSRAAPLAISNLVSLGEYGSLISASTHPKLSAEVRLAANAAVKEAKLAELKKLDASDLSTCNLEYTFEQVKKFIKEGTVSEEAKPTLNRIAQEQITFYMRVDPKENFQRLLSLMNDADLTENTRQKAALAAIAVCDDVYNLFPLATTAFNVTIKEKAAEKLIDLFDGSEYRIPDLLVLIEDKTTSQTVREKAIVKQLELIKGYTITNQVTSIVKFIDCPISEQQKDQAREKLVQLLSADLDDMSTRGYYHIKSISTAIEYSNALLGDQKALFDLHLLTVGTVAIEKNAEYGNFDDILTFVDSERTPKRLKELGERKLSEQLPLLVANRDFDTTFVKESNLYLKRRTRNEPHQPPQSRMCS